MKVFQKEKSSETERRKNRQKQPVVEVMEFTRKGEVQ
jgi:hypothetical protein